MSSARFLRTDSDTQTGGGPSRTSNPKSKKTQKASLQQNSNHGAAGPRTSTTRTAKLSAVIGGETRSIRAGSDPSNKKHHTSPLPKLPKGVRRYTKDDPLTFSREDAEVVGTNVKEFLQWVKDKEARKEGIGAAIERDWEDAEETKKSAKVDNGKPYLRSELGIMTRFGVGMRLNMRGWS
jgi:hypothetical protein